MNQNAYIRLSLELHLFFDRIMKEHSFFLEAAFSEKDKELKKQANEFQMIFSNILENAIVLANGNMSKEFLNAGEILTPNTLLAEKKTSHLSGIQINTRITEMEYQLKAGNIEVNPQILNYISVLNQKTLSMVQQLIQFKNDILNQVLSCKMYTTNYPLLIQHIMNEAKVYYSLLDKIEKREVLSEYDIYEQELFWNNIMKEHAEFIRGLLDPSEKELIKTANQYAIDYEEILSEEMNNSMNLTMTSLEETLRFRDFKLAGEEGILNCQIKSIIIPLLADHVVREVNHFIQILRNYQASI